MNSTVVLGDVRLYARLIDEHIANRNAVGAQLSYRPKTMPPGFIAEQKRAAHVRANAGV